MTLDEMSHTILRDFHLALRVSLDYTRVFEAMVTRYKERFPGPYDVEIRNIDGVFVFQLSFASEAEELMWVMKWSAEPFVDDDDD